MGEGGWGVVAGTAEISHLDLKAGGREHIRNGRNLWNFKVCPQWQTSTRFVLLILPKQFQQMGTYIQTWACGAHFHWNTHSWCERGVLHLVLFIVKGTAASERPPGEDEVRGRSEGREGVLVAVGTSLAWSRNFKGSVAEVDWISTRGGVNWKDEGGWAVYVEATGSVKGIVFFFFGFVRVSWAVGRHRLILGFYKDPLLLIVQKSL